MAWKKEEKMNQKNDNSNIAVSILPDNIIKANPGEQITDYAGNQDPIPLPTAIEGNTVPFSKPQETEYTKRMKTNFGSIGLAAFLYACLYAFCLYRNASGITFPFFIAGSLFFFCFCLQKLEISLQRGSIYYMTGIILLGVSTFCTDDARMILMNKTGIFLLIISLLLKQIYNTSDWGLGKYLSSIIAVSVMSLGQLARPFQDGRFYFKNYCKEKNQKGFFVLTGVLVAIPLLLLVLSLLISADAVFRDLTSQIFEKIQFGNIMLVIYMIAFMFLASYCILSYLCKKSLKEEVTDRRKGEPLLAMTITLLLTILYLIFSGIQIVYLFMGRMQLPKGYTYAEYAREGFFQLLAVSILNLVIVLIVLSFFRENKILKAILVLMSFCTFVMIASSAMRMIIYIKFYYLTFLRIFVLWSLAVLFLLFSGVIISIFQKKFPLFRYSIAVITICYLILSFSHPDYWIAKVNVSNMEGQERSEFFVGEPYQDYSYLTFLSADAAPVLIPYLTQQNFLMEFYYNPGLAAEDIEGKRAELEQYHIPIASHIYFWQNNSYGYYYLNRLRDRIDGKSWRNFNISRYMAEKQVEKYSKIQQES